MGNVVAFTSREKLEAKESYTWMELMFKDSLESSSVCVQCYSWGGGGEWTFLPVAIIEDFDSETGYLFLYDADNDMFFIHAWWRIDENGEWCELFEKEIAEVIEGLNPNNYDVEKKAIFCE